jgi:hypothetical protein
LVQGDALCIHDAIIRLSLKGSMVIAYSVHHVDHE